MTFWGRISLACVSSEPEYTTLKGMHTLKQTRLFLIVVWAAAWAVSAAAGESDSVFTTVTASIAPVRVKDGGHLIVGLYNDKEAWPKLVRALMKQTVPADTETLTVTFDSVSPGSYSLLVIHDKNDNGKLDMRWFPWPKPKEGTGVSNNHKGRPKYDDASFEVGDIPIQFDVVLHY